MSPSCSESLIIILRILSALFCPITDCDEVFNYWEPAHFLIYGHGLQTWEYAPQFALRSYLFLWIYSIPAKIFSSFFAKVTVFYLVRILIAVITGISEICLKRALDLNFAQFSGNFVTLAVMLPGYFIAASAFLPSSFCLIFSNFALASHISKNFVMAIFCVACASIIGWPFSCVIGAGIALEMVCMRKYLKSFVIYSLISLVTLSIPLILVDSYYYGKLCFSTLNIILYNVFGGSKGPSLYGVEPFSYYLMNAFINLNVVFLFSVPSVILVFAASCLLPKQFFSLNGGYKSVMKTIRLHICSLPLWIWVAIFFFQPHKEERFMFPVYPHILILCLITLKYLENIISYWSKNVAKILFAVLILSSYILCISRIHLLSFHFSAPFHAYSHLHTYESSITHQSIHVCVGKEWYRFPSHFFLPNDRWRLYFVEDEVKDQLPRMFPSQSEALIPTREFASNLNDLNREEKDRYISLELCDFFIGLKEDYMDSSILSKNLISTHIWKVVYTKSFLSVEKSKSFFRTFSLGPVSYGKVFSTYSVWKKI